VKAVLFDFGNVICKFDMRLFVEKITPLTTIPASRLHEILHKSFDLGRAYETGLITSDQFFQQISQRYALAISKQDFICAFTDVFTPIPSTLRLIHTLKPSYKLGLLSNTNEWHFEHVIKRYDVYPLFDAVTVSFEVGAMKPAEKIYRDALTKLDVRPDDCIYIDDLQENLDGARRLGILGILYTSHEKLVSELRESGVRL
jgi:putative hydrolase of the HAD superfamily